MIRPPSNTIRPYVVGASAGILFSGVIALLLFGSSPCTNLDLSSSELRYASVSSLASTIYPKVSPTLLPVMETAEIASTADKFTPEQVANVPTQKD